MAVVQIQLFHPTQQRPAWLRLIAPAPAEHQRQMWRVGGLDRREGHMVGNIMNEKVPGGYLVALRFEDGSISAFHPMQLFPVLDN